jgi:pimeloyl-ACP methyl ester carboxylesterase
MSSAKDLPSVERKGILVLHRSGLAVTSTASSGQPQQPAVYILISGFPDNSSTFDVFAKPFEKQYHVVKVSYPDMDETTLRSFWGYSLKQVELALVDVIQEYRNNHKCDTIYLHGFDWGAIVTLMIAHQYPNIITKLIQQDIGIVNAMQLSLYNMAVLPSYQLYLAMVFLLSRTFLGHDVLASQILGFLPRCFPWFLLMTESPPGMLSQMLPHRCYPYWRMVVDVLCGTVPHIRFAPTVPQFFAYGSKKSVLFHTGGYLKKLESTPGCQWNSYPGSHWFHTTQTQEFQRDVLDFLNT